LQADIAIVIDESGSVGTANFEHIKAFAAKLIRSFKDEAGPDLKIGLEKFSTSYTVQGPLTTDLESLAQKAASMGFGGGWTNTRAGYQGAA